MPIPGWVIATFWGSAVVVSGLLGYFCLEVHNVKVPEEYPRAARIHQRWFNFTGSLAGWVALWCLVRRAGGVSWFSSSSGQATGSDFALAFVAFVGVSGYLPYATMGAVKALETLVAEALKRARELLTGGK
jgi:hypothetical protein